LVECYWPGVSELRLAVSASRVRQAVARLCDRGRELQFVGSILVPADETVFWLFDGEEADVRAASEQAGVTFDRILESLRLINDGMKEEK
jgi:hypothetical protein